MALDTTAMGHKKIIEAMLDELDDLNSKVANKERELAGLKRKRGSVRRTLAEYDPSTVDTAPATGCPPGPFTRDDNSRKSSTFVRFNAVNGRLYCTNTRKEVDVSMSIKRLREFVQAVYVTALEREKETTLMDRVLSAAALDSGKFKFNYTETAIGFAWLTDVGLLSMHTPRGGYRSMKPTFLEDARTKIGLLVAQQEGGE